jgi:hypothetical protein
MQRYLAEIHTSDQTFATNVTGKISAGRTFEVVQLQPDVEYPTFIYYTVGGGERGNT